MQADPFVKRGTNLLPSNSERQWKDVSRDLVVGSVVISHLGVELKTALPKPIGEASTDVPAKCVGTPASRYDLHAADCAPKPPGPVRTADNTHTRRRRFTRAMVPTASADHVRSRFGAEREVNDRIKRQGILASACAGCLKLLLARRIDRQIVPHEFTVYADMFGEVVPASDDEVSSVIDERAQVPLGETNASTNVEVPLAVILRVHRIE